MSLNLRFQTVQDSQKIFSGNFLFHKSRESSPFVFEKLVDEETVHTWLLLKKICHISSHSWLSALKIFQDTRMAKLCRVRKLKIKKRKYFIYKFLDGRPPQNQWFSSRDQMSQLCWQAWDPNERFCNRQ